MSGCSASAEGTRRFAQRALDDGNPDSAYRALGRTALVTSGSLGFGSYRIDNRTPSTPRHWKRRFSVASISSTLPPTIPTAQVTCIGNVLTRHRREELIVVSKVGYVQGQALTVARAREHGGAASGDGEVHRRMLALHPPRSFSPTSWSGRWGGSMSRKWMSISFTIPNTFHGGDQTAQEWFARSATRRVLRPDPARLFSSRR